MRLIDLLLALLVVSIWGFNFVVIQLGLQGLPPLFLCFLRFFLTSLPAVFFIRPPATSFRQICLYGLIMFALQFSLLFTGMYAGVSAGIASIVLQCQVFFVVLFAMIFLGERAKFRQILGGLISFSGVALVAMNRSGTLTLLGLVLILLAAISWGAGSVIIKKIGKVNLPALVIWGSLVAWPPLLMMSLLIEGSDKILAGMQQMAWTTIGSVAYITYLSTLLCFVLWNRLLQRYSLATIAPFSFLVPVFAMSGASLVLDEPVQAWKIIAVCLIISGLSLNLMRDRRSVKNLPGTES